MSLLKTPEIKKLIDTLCDGIDGSDMTARQGMIRAMDFEMTLQGIPGDAEQLFLKMFNSDKSDLEHDLKILRKLASDLTFYPDQLLD